MTRGVFPRAFLLAGLHMPSLFLAPESEVQLKTFRFDLLALINAEVVRGGGGLTDH